MKNIPYERTVASYPILSKEYSNKNQIPADKTNILSKEPRIWTHICYDGIQREWTTTPNNRYNVGVGCNYCRKHNISINRQLNFIANQKIRSNQSLSEEEIDILLSSLMRKQFGLNKSSIKGNMILQEYRAAFQDEHGKLEREKLIKVLDSWEGICRQTNEKRNQRTAERRKQLELEKQQPQSQEPQQPQESQQSQQSQQSQEKE